MQGAAKEVYNYAIIGGGLLGSSVGYHLSRISGGAASICILERGSRTDYATHGNTQYSTGLITSSHKSTVGRSLVEQTFTDLADLAALGFDPSFRKMGCVDVSLIGAVNSGRGSLNNILHFDGWAEVFEDESQRLIYEDFIVSEQFSRDGCVSPTDLADCYRNAAKAINPYGLEVKFDADICAVMASVAGSGSGSGDLVELITSSGENILARNVINAAGAWVDSIGVPPEAAAGGGAEGSGVPMGLMRADYWMLQAPRPIPADTPLLTLAGAYIKPMGNVVEIGTYRDEQLVYEHADDPCEQEDNELEAITCKLELLQTFIPDIEEFAPMHYTSAKTTYTPDGMPVLGYVSTHPGVPPMFAVSGCNGYGVTWAGGFGRMVSEVVLGMSALPVEVDAARFASWSRADVMAGAAEKRRTKFGTFPITTS